MGKRILQSLLILAVLAGTFASAGSAWAWSNCPSQIVVQWGDTLSGIAATCGVSMDAIRAANPGLGWWVYAGQVLNIPNGYIPVNYPVPVGGGTYVVQWGDSLRDIADRYGVSVFNVIAVNPQIPNPNLIYPGQVINLPPRGNVPGPTLPPPPPPYNPTPIPTGYGTLKVTYQHGLLVRTGPGKNYPEIVSVLVSAVKNTNWRYNKTTLTTDAKGMVWAEVLLPAGSGYATGWILVRDQFMHYFTEPKINP